MSNPYYEKIMDKEPKEIPEHALKDLFSDFACLIRTYFELLDKPLWESLVKKKFGLEDGVRRSLADIGREFNFTRERARQIQFQVLHDLKRLMSGRALRKPRVFCDPSKYSYRAFEDSLRDRRLIALPQAVKLVRGLSKKILPHSENYTDFLMAIFGFDATEHKGVKFYFKEFQYVHVTGMVAKLKHLFKNQALYMTAQKIKKELDMSQDDLEAYLYFIDDLEIKTVGVTQYYRLPIKDLVDTEVAVYRILYECGSPMHIRDIRDTIIKAGRAVTIVSISPLLVKSKRMRAIGKSGLWVLDEWNIDTSTIQEILVRVFKTVGHPLNDLEVQQKVSVYRPIDIITARSYIHLYKTIFVCYVDGTYGLKEWGLKTPTMKKRKMCRRAPLLRDKVLKDATIILTAHEGEMLLCDLVSELSKNGYEAPLVYNALSRRKDLFLKGPMSGRGKVITLK